MEGRARLYVNGAVYRGGKHRGPIPRERWSEFFDVDDDDPEFQSGELLEYVATAAAIGDRLDFIGFTVETAKKAFRIGCRRELQEQRESLARLRDWILKEESLRAQLPAAEERVNVIETMLSPETWMEGLREITSRELTARDDRRKALELSPVVQYMLDAVDMFGFPGYVDPRYALRLMVEVLNSAIVTFELTDLCLGGCLDANDSIVDIAISWLSHEDRIARRVVVLTEGSTDTWVLQRTMRLLEPDIADFFSFMDFEGARIEGGASALASIVKAFVATGIENRVLALFDNDTAGLAALRRLSSIKFPENIIALQYPPLWLARDYPTLGPNGLTSMDVNGMACSLELYLGMDVLKDEDNNLLPVHWRAFDSSVGQYQGEITDKKLVLERFNKKLDTCEQDRHHLADYDWSGLRSIIHIMKTAFHDVDAQTLLDFEDKREDENDSDGE